MKSKFVRKLVFAGIFTLFLFTLPVGMVPLNTAAAQEDQEGFKLDEIVITGTRIRGAETVGASVVGIDRMEIENLGGVTVDRSIKELPQVFDLGVTESSRNSSAGGGNIVYGNTINLHGIGPYATLILVDGHRVVNNSRSTDPSVMPSLGLERIEIVADGASAVYGSDAIAGVVNLIPRRSLNGFEVNLRYGTGDQFNEHNIGVAGGKVWSRGQVMLAVEHAFRDNLNGDDRNFYTSDQRSFGGGDYRVTRSSPGTIKVGSTTFAIPAGGVTPDNAGSLVPGTVNLFDDLPGQDLLPQQEYTSLNATFTQTITNYIEFFADGFYSKREFERLPAYLSASLAVPDTNAWFVQPPGTTDTSYAIDYSFINDLVRDKQVGSAENWQVTPGLRFDLPLDFQIEALYTYGENDDESLQSHGLDTRGSLVTALRSSDPATAFDPYGLHRTTGAVLAEISDQIYNTPTLNTFKGYEVRLNGPLFKLPAGAVGLAAGYEGQEMDVSLGIARGTPGTPVAFRDFSRRVDSLYAEILVPVFGGANAISGINRLEFSGAIRYDDYDDVGDTTNPKFGFNYSPMESLSFHGSWGTSFRAPLISEIYGNSNALYGQSYQNPTGGAPLTGFAFSGANLDLEPEEATTWSIGADFNPIENMNFRFTYFDVNYEKQIEKYLSNLSLLTIEDQFAGTGIILHGTAARDRVLQLLAQGIPLARGSFPGGDPNNVDLYIDGRNNNLGVSITRGIDFLWNYNWETGSAGSFLFTITGTYLTTYEVSITPAGERIDRLNTIYNPLRLKARGSVLWDYRDFSTQLVINYVNRYDNNAVTPTQKVDSYTPVDIIVRFNGENVRWLGNFGKGLSVGLEARNLFDEDPPYVNIAQGANGGGGYDPTASNPVGRLIAFSMRKIW